MLVNTYNANTEQEQLHTLNNLINILEAFEDFQNKRVVLGGGFNVNLNPSLNSVGGNTVIKNKTVFFKNLLKPHIL